MFFFITIIIIIIRIFISRIHFCCSECDKNNRKKISVWIVCFFFVDIQTKISGKHKYILKIKHSNEIDISFIHSIEACVMNKKKIFFFEWINKCSKWNHQTRRFFECWTVFFRFIRYRIQFFSLNFFFWWPLNIFELFGKCFISFGQRGIYTNL